MCVCPYNGNFMTFTLYEIQELLTLVGSTLIRTCSEKLQQKLR